MPVCEISKLKVERYRRWNIGTRQYAIEKINWCVWLQCPLRYWEDYFRRAEIKKDCHSFTSLLLYLYLFDGKLGFVERKSRDRYVSDLCSSDCYLYRLWNCTIIRWRMYWFEDELRTTRLHKQEYIMKDSGTNCFSVRILIFGTIRFLKLECLNINSVHLIRFRICYLTENHTSLFAQLKQKSEGV